MKESSTPNRPLAGGQPHLAYVVLWYPLFTQPFIFREVEELRKVMPVQVYALYGRNMRHCSAEMQENHACVINYGARSVPVVIGGLLREAFTHPIRLARLFSRSCLRKWPSIEILGENLWGFCVGICLGRRFMEDGIDMVYSPWPRGAATAAWVGANMAGIPFGIAARGDNLEPADPDLDDKFSAACVVRANNAADRERIEKFGRQSAKGKTRLVYNSLTLPALANAKTSHQRKNVPARLLAMGRFDVTKGFDVLLHSCAILKRQKVPFILTLAGGGGKVMGLGNLEDKLRALRRELNLEAEVIMPGLISHDDLPGVMREHDIFIAPCIIHSSGRRDGIPNTIIEAMAAGLPVVSSNINAIPEIVHHNETGLLTEPGDPRSLAAAISQLIADPEKCASLGNNAARLASELFAPGRNAQNLAHVLADAYSQCAGRNRENCSKSRVDR